MRERGRKVDIQTVLANGAKSHSVLAVTVMRPDVVLYESEYECIVYFIGLTTD